MTRRRPKVGGKPIKGRRPKASKPKRGLPTSQASRPTSPSPGDAGEIARLNRELNEALERQAATSEVLQFISSSPGDLEPVFTVMLEKAVRICEAKFGTIYGREGDALYLVARHNAPPSLAAASRPANYRPGQKTPLGRMFATKQVVHVSDLAADQSYVEQREEGVVAAVELGGVRTILAVPMLKESELVGAFLVFRPEVRPFTDRQIELVKNFAAQAVIAIENARLLNELRQSLEQQTATSQVLQVISSSPGELEPVFGAMLQNAVRICDAKFGNIHRWDGEALHLVAAHNTPPAFAKARRRSPARPSPKSSLGRMIATKALVHVADAAEEPGYAEERDASAVAAVELGGVRTVLYVPMLKENELVGAFTLSRQEVRPFSAKQIELVQNFAAQAVIAIDNARLLNELRQSLEQQTATADVLKVISSSPGDLQPVFETLLRNAAQLCKAKIGTLFLHEEGRLRLVAAYDLPTLSEVQAGIAHEAAPGGPLEGAIRTRKAVQIVDLAATEAYKQRHPRMVEAVELGGIRTAVAVPMLKDEEVIGVIAIQRSEVVPFDDKQIALLTNFAAQAVIAIENARLLNELRQSLQQQTVTADVLKIISRSTFDLQTVLDTLTESAARLCSADHGVIFQRDGDLFRFGANYGFSPEAVRYALQHPLPPSRSSLTGRVALEDRAVHIPDALTDPAYRATEYQQVFGYRTMLGVPLLREGTTIGVFVLTRREVKPFTEEQIELVTTFADQGVIAIENARLLNELRQRTDDLSQRTTDLTEALEQQTATSDVLEVISRSAFDLQAVFKTVAESSVRLCGADRAFIFRFDGELLRMVVGYNSTPAFVEWVAKNPIRPGRHSGSARAALERRTIHITDVLADPEYVYGAKDVEPIRTVLGVPILKGDDLLGVMMIYRLEVRPFTERQIALVETFADQAAIAIENVRLLDELRERTEEVEKLNQQLEQRVADQVGEIERMGRLRRFLPPQVADLIVASGSEKQLESHRREITALFCDLRGFTGFTESADAEDVMALLRDYHAAIGEIIIKYNGTLERYAGDGVMVVFNDPVPVENAALQAVLMALEVRDAIGALTETWRRWGHDIGFGIGIAHGFATLGTIGFEGRFDYAAIGTVSNVASRLCDEAKPGQILISPRVLTKVENAVKVEPVGEFALKGIRRPLAAYNVVAALASKI